MNYEIKKLFSNGDQTLIIPNSIMTCYDFEKWIKNTIIERASIKNYDEISNYNRCFRFSQIYQLRPNDIKIEVNENNKSIKYYNRKSINNKVSNVNID